MRFLRSLRSVGMTSRTVISTGAKRNGEISCNQQPIYLEITNFNISLVPSPICNILWSR